MISILNDIAQLTSIPKLTLEKLSDKAAISIADNVLEAMLNKESQIALDIGLGVLNIKLEENAIKYKFIPSKYLDNNIAYALKSKQSPLVCDLDKALAERIKATYKELI